MPWENPLGRLLSQKPRPSFASLDPIGILLVWRMLKDRKAGFPVADERTQMITGRAARISLNAGSYFIIAILIGTIIAREFLGVGSFGEDFYSYSLIAVLLVQSLSFLLLRWYLGR